MRSAIILFIAFTCSFLTLANANSIADNVQLSSAGPSKRNVGGNRYRNTGSGTSNVRLAHAKKFKKQKNKKGLTDDILNLLGGSKKGGLL
ncbi:hypothetical protein INT47_008320 [Mucor saturninus]|uniref:RxLR effector protein n=1 Tax=Mucor saturninus TaxID=64648 RepID=A0A8H7REG7_9FUNG|nr:hypothetical protein INT47_008320 [Mucor saturninus]